MATPSNPAPMPPGPRAPPLISGTPATRLMRRVNIEYTPDFLWSNTVQQAAAACSDYFRWNDFLTGGGNDHAEGGWSDRNYYGLALACSTGILNTTPNAYAAAWGMPDAVGRRHQALADAYRGGRSPAFQASRIANIAILKC